MAAFQRQANKVGAKKAWGLTFDPALPIGTADGDARRVGVDLVERPLIRADDVFTGNEQVVETLPVFDFDDKTQIIYYLNGDEWHHYPLPAEIGQVIDTESRSDGTYLLKNYGDESTWHLFE